jgi:cysteine-S-conjugate beta-lyase
MLSMALVALSAGIAFGASVGWGFARLNFGTTRAIIDKAISAIAAALPDKSAG